MAEPKVTWGYVQRIADKLDDVWIDKVRPGDNGECSGCFELTDDPTEGNKYCPLTKNWTTPFPIKEDDSNLHLRDVYVRWDFDYDEAKINTLPRVKSCYICEDDMISPRPLIPGATRDDNLVFKTLMTLREYNIDESWDPYREHIDSGCLGTCYEEPDMRSCDLFLLSDADDCTCKSLFRVAPLNDDNELDDAVLRNPPSGVIVEQDDISCIANLNWDAYKPTQTGKDLAPFPTFQCNCQELTVFTLKELAMSDSECNNELIPCNYLIGERGGFAGWNWGKKAGPKETRQWGELHSGVLDAEADYTTWVAVGCTDGSDNVWFKIVKTYLDNGNESFVIASAVRKLSNCHLVFANRQRWVRLIWNRLRLLVGPEVDIMTPGSCQPDENTVPQLMAGNFSGHVLGATFQPLWATGVQGVAKYHMGAGMDTEFINNYWQKSNEQCPAASQFSTCGNAAETVQIPTESSFEPLPNGPCPGKGDPSIEIPLEPSSPDLPIYKEPWRGAINPFPEAIDVGFHLERIVGAIHESSGDTYEKPGCIKGPRLSAYEPTMLYTNVHNLCYGYYAKLSTGDSDFTWDNNCTNHDTPGTITQTSQFNRSVWDFDISQLPWEQNTCTDKLSQPPPPCSPAGTYQFTFEFLDYLVDFIAEHKVNENNYMSAEPRWIGPCQYARDSTESGNRPDLEPIESGSNVLHLRGEGNLFATYMIMVPKNKYTQYQVSVVPGSITPKASENDYIRGIVVQAIMKSGDILYSDKVSTSSAEVHIFYWDDQANDWMPELPDLGKPAVIHPMETERCRQYIQPLFLFICASAGGITWDATITLS